jgi:RES domain-containing protein
MASRRSGPLRAFRIADMRHTLFDGSGAMLHGARWKSPGRRVIYAAESYAGALLEILVHASGSVPRSQGYVEIEIPAGLSIEELTPADLPRWNSPRLKHLDRSVIDGMTSAAPRSSWCLP